MEMTTKILTLLALTSSICLPANGTTQEILGKIRLMRPSTLQAFKDIQHNIENEIETTKKKIQHIEDRTAAQLKQNLLELKAAKTDIKDQIRHFAESTAPHRSAAEQIKDTFKVVTKHLPSAEQISDKIERVKDDTEEKAFAAIHSSKRMWRRFVRGIKKVPSKIKFFFTGKKKPTT